VGINQALLSITKSQVSDFTSGTVTSAGTAQQAGTALFATNASTAVFATTAGTSTTISGTITKSQVSDFTSGTVASAGTAQQSGTAVYAVNAGTAVYATTSGTAVTISGDITKSQVSDFTSGTVTTISGSITKSQVSDFTSGTVTSASTAQQSGTAVFANTSGTATFATNSGTAVFATNAGTSVFATTSGTASFATNASTAVSVSGSAITQSQVVNLVSDLAGKASLGSANTFTVGGHTITNAATAVIPLVIKGASGQSADLLKIQSSAASDLFTVRNDGQITTVAGINATGLSLNSFGGAAVSGRIVHITTSNATLVPLNVRGAASQSANLQEWQNSAGTILGRIKSDGTPTFSYGTFFGQQTLSADGDAVKPLVVKGFSATQSGNLQEWQNSAGTALARVLSDGQWVSSAINTSNNYVRLLEANSGGTLQLTRMTAAAGNPGANVARLFLRDGTNAGTLKLVVRAGASGAETTILDNIPQT
jgi:hypothetical protein